MSSANWLRAYNSADLRESVYNKGSGAGAWSEEPSLTCDRLDSCSLTRASTLSSAVKYNQDWTFSQQDKGAFTLTLDGTRSSKNGIVIAIGSDMADAFGFYVILTPMGVRVIRRVIGEHAPHVNQSLWNEQLAIAPGTVESVPAPLQKGGVVQFTVVYEYGTFSIFDGDYPGRGTLLVKYVNPKPGMGNYKYGFGLYGAPNGDKLSIIGLTKWKAGLY